MVTEFYSPFAHLPGKLEWCRIHGPTHGSFDCAIVIEATTADPVTVYVNSDNGEAFMADRFPESTCIRVPSTALRMEPSPDRLRLHCHLQAEEGPLRTVVMAFRAEAGVPRETAYGGGPCWGSKWTCNGVDLELDATVTGSIHWADRTETLSGDDAILTVGSYGTLTEA